MTTFVSTIFWPGISLVLLQKQADAVPPLLPETLGKHIKPRPTGLRISRRELEIRFYPGLLAFLGFASFPNHRRRPSSPATDASPSSRRGEMKAPSESATLRLLAVHSSGLM
jgi:hypothetical protein